MNNLIFNANALLKNQNFEYAICGGYAIDLFIGKETRTHSDIDIHAYWNDRDNIILYMQSIGFEVFEMLGGGKAHHITDIKEQYIVKRNIFCYTSECNLVDIQPTDENEIYFINFKHIGQTRLNFIEFLFNEKKNDAFVYGRNSNITQKLDEAILHRDNVPYLSPEICLLYKSTDTERDGYQQDFELAIKSMSQKQISWLQNALKLTNSNGHKWIL